MIWLLLAQSAQAGILDNVTQPEDISTYGHLIDSLFNYVTGMNIFFFFLVCVGLFGFSWAYHHKRHPKPVYTHGTTKKQIIVVTIIGAAVFFCIDLAITGIATRDLNETFWNWPDEEKEDVLKVEILAQQWAWNFRYAGKDGKFNTVDDVVLLNDLRIPAGKKVIAQISSKDVIHSFYLPNFRAKVDAIPGRITRLWFEAKEGAEGKYDIACAEMCGTHHYLMKAQLTVYKTEAEFDQWLDQERTYNMYAVDEENLDTFWGWKWQYQEQ